MLKIRRSNERGHANHGWLDSYHSFSFAQYHDPAHMQFGPLRVINDDRIAQGGGFGTHPHRDMEIVTYVLDGALAHRDSMGNGAVMRAGDVQRMSAGTGVSHSEFNAAEQTTHLLQIWVVPERNGSAPGYEQQHFDAASKRGKLRLVVDREGSEGALRWQQNARLYAGLFDGMESAELALAKGRGAYLHVARGSVTVNDQLLQPGDALMLQDEPEVRIRDGAQSEVLLFDLPWLDSRHA